MQSNGKRGGFMAAAIVVAIIGVTWRTAVAGCNTVPSPMSFAGTKGVLDRPFSVPGRPVEVALRSCDRTTFSSTNAEDYVVTVAVGALATGTPRTLMAVTAKSSNCATIEGACSGFKVACKVAQTALVVPDAQHLRFPFPEATRQPSGVAGPGAIAVALYADKQPVVCGLASGTCSTQASQSGVLACVDELYVDDGSCGTKLHPAFQQFTALPPSNVFKNECSEAAPPCTPLANVPHTIAVAVDARGNLLIPIDWQGISPALMTPADLAHLRWVHGATRHKSQPFAVPSKEFLGAYSPEGRVLPEVLFEVASNGPVVETSGTVSSWTDTVLRITPWACDDGTKSPKPCNDSSDCKGVPCKKLYDLGPTDDAPIVYTRDGGSLVCRKREAGKHKRCVTGNGCGGYGPCDGYALEADANKDLVPLTPTITTATLIVHVVLQPSPDNPNDPAVAVRDRASGLSLAIPSRLRGGAGHRDARPAPELADGIVEGLFPVAAEGDVVAFLEMGTCDRDGDPAPTGAVLRALERTHAESGEVRLSDRTPKVCVAADPAPVVNGRSVVVSDGLVFFRAARSADAVPVLEALEPARDAQGGVPIAPAHAVAVAGSLAAFLRPFDDAAPRGGHGGAPPRGDVELWSPEGGVRSLGRSAEAVALSREWIAALVPRPAKAGAPPAAEVAVHPAHGGSWTDLGQAADTVAVSRSVVAFLTPERAQDARLNCDHDRDDRVLQIYHADTRRLVNVKQAAEEFVLGEPEPSACAHQLVAFRTSERAQGADLNHDGDRADDVLQVFDLKRDRLIGTGQAVVPCTLEGCARVPYRISGGQVRFLTRECDQGGPVRSDKCPGGGTDLNGDGDADDTVVQVFDAHTRRTTPIAALELEAAHQGVDPLRDDGGGLVFPSPARRCVAGLAHVLGNASTCVRDADCGAGGTCVPTTLVMAIATTDRDHDGIPDGVDPRPEIRDARAEHEARSRPGPLCRLFHWCPRSADSGHGKSRAR